MTELQRLPSTPQIAMYVKLTVMTFDMTVIFLQYHTIISPLHSLYTT